MVCDATVVYVGFTELIIEKTYYVSYTFTTDLISNEQDYSTREITHITEGNSARFNGTKSHRRSQTVLSTKWEDIHQRRRANLRDEYGKIMEGHKEADLSSPIS